MCYSQIINIIFSLVFIKFLRLFCFLGCDKHFHYGLNLRVLFLLTRSEPIISKSTTYRGVMNVSQTVEASSSPRQLPSSRSCCDLFQVTAMNHVSMLTEDFNVTVDRLQPMANLTVKGVPDVVPQGSTQTLTTSVLVDMSVAATFRYERGWGIGRFHAVFFMLFSRQRVCCA